MAHPVTNTASEAIIQVATVTDAAFLPYAATMANTLAAHRAPHSHVVLTVLHNGVPAADQERLAGGAEGVDVRWHEVRPEVYAGHGLECFLSAFNPTYFRCLLAEVYPDAVERVLYLDADVIVLGDLAELWRTDLGGAPVGAVRDALPTIRDGITRWPELGLDGDAPYFNAGVMVIDLRSWRQSGAGWAVVERCAADRDHLVAQGRWPQHDQYGFNIVFHKRWQALSPTWNYFTHRPYRRSNIVHFLGAAKPGGRYCHPRFTQAFLTAVDRTAWAGWRPPSLRPGWRWRFYENKVRRALHLPRRRDSHETAAK